jgi:4-amino-4-deoxy-L-arabinose transferase-like glycosyltransferase
MGPLALHDVEVTTPQSLQKAESFASKALLGLALLISALMVFLWLNSVPGLHADEAFVGIRAHDIIQGERPILGMNGYTGSIHQYFAALSLSLFGFQVWALRAFGALMAVISVFLYYLCVKRLSDARFASLSALILATMPFFVGFSRIANEVFMLNPVLCLGATYLLLTADEYSLQTRRVFYFYAGILMGIGIWTHVIFLSFATAVLIAALFRRKLELFTSSPFYFVITGALISLSPRIYYQLSSHDSLKASFRLSDFLKDFLSGVGSRFHEWPSVFLHVLHGDEIFQRFTGAILFNPLNLSACLWIASFIFIVVGAVKKGARSIEALLLAFTIPLMITTLIMSPGNAERYLLLPLYSTPVFIAFLFWRLLDGKKFYAAIILFTCFQLSLIGVDYFHSFLQTGGQNSLFDLGEQEETSNHYINTKDLFLKLNKLDATQICSEFFIAEPLKFYKLSTSGGFEISSDETDCLRKEGPKRLSVYAVVYKLGKRLLNLDKLPGFTPIMSDTHFLILEPRRTRSGNL